MNEPAAIRILLADDHGLFRAGIRSLLASIEGIAIVAEAGDGREAVKLAAAHRPDIVLMDIMMPQLNGLDATARIVREHPRTRIIVLSMNTDEDAVVRALRAGALSYLVKTADPAELERAIHAAMLDQRFLSSAISQHVARACLGRIERDRGSLDRLSPRQREVLQLVAEGHSTKQIAAKLGIAPKTAEEYRGDLMRVLDIHDVASLTRYAIRSGLVSAG